MGTPGTAALLLCLAVCVSALPGEAAQELTTPGSGFEAPCDGCPRHKKSATLVPSFTKTTKPHRTTTPRTTPPANHTTPHRTTTPRTTPPANHTTPHRTTTPRTTPPANHTTPHRTTTPRTTPPANHTTPHRTTPPRTTPPANHTTPHRTTPPRTTPPANHTTPHRTTMPPTPLPGPAVGDYRVQNGSEVCLRVQSALQFRVQYDTPSKAKQWGVFSVRPKDTVVSGACAEDAATLELRFPEGLLSFTFVKNKTRDTVYLSEVQANLSLQFSGAPGLQVFTSNTSLREFEARLGHSYRCQNRSLALGPGFRLDALHEQTQAFALRGGAFGEAEMCPEEGRSPLVPIIIGVVLLVLILIILIAYLVGRRRTRGGYQTL